MEVITETKILQLTTRKEQNMANQHRHLVDFVAHKTVKVPEQVAFVTNKGEIVSFPAHKEQKQSVEVKFKAKG